MLNNPTNSLHKSASLGTASSKPFSQNQKQPSDEGITIEIDSLPRSLDEEKALLLADARVGGKLYSQGIATEFVENPILKSAEKTVNNSTSVDPSTSFTRGANIIEINQHLLRRSSDDDIASMVALTNDKIDLVNRFRRKRIAYGNHNAMHEVMSQKLFSLTGMFSPDTKIMIHESEIRENGTLEVSIISPMITGYKDLGDFLTDNAARRFIDPKNHESWMEKKKEIEDINEQKSITDQDKTRRIKLMSEIYDMLPNYFHNEIEKAFAASKFIGNWDFANFNLNNIGCKFELDRDGNIISFCSAFVDFGNSGVIGFGGKYKELSYQRANTEAKSKEAKPQEYDPALKLTKEEERLVRYKMKRDAARIIDSEFSDIKTNANSDKNFQDRLRTQAKNNLINKLDDDNLDQNLESIISEIAKSELRKTGIEFKENEEKKLQMEELIKAEMIRICSTDHPSPEEKKLQNQLKNKSINNLYLSLIEAEESKSEEKSFALRNEDLIRSIIFKTSHHIREEESDIVIDKNTVGLLTVSDLPRHLPFAFVLKDALKQKTKEVTEKSSIDYDKTEPLHLRESFYRDSEIEMAFRLSLIPDEAIKYITKKWDLRYDYPQTFAAPTDLPYPDIYQGESLAGIFNHRRDVLANSVPKEIIDNWVKKNRAKAITAEESVRLSIIEQSDGSCDIVRKNSVSARTESDIEYPKMKDLVTKIKSEIEKKKKEIHDNIDLEDQEMKEAKQNIEDKEKLLERNKASQNLLKSAAIDPEIMEELKNTFVKNIESMTSEIARDSIRLKTRTAELTNNKILEFIDRSSKTWNLKIFDSDPSFDLFDLRRIATIASKQNQKPEAVSLSEPAPSFKSPIKSSPVRSMSKSTSTFSFITVDSDSDSDNNKKPSGETLGYQPDQNTLNLLIYDEFIKILDKISNNIQTVIIPASSADAKAHCKLNDVEQKLEPERVV